MDDPNIIATLIATDHLAKRAFSLAHNRDRYLPPLSVDCALSSRENTPFPGENLDDEDTAVGHRLELSFDKPPKNVREGFEFGWDPDCDVQLVDRKNVQPEDRNDVQYISKRHFSITFDQQRRVILRDKSRVGTAVSYDGQAKDEIRSHFTWIIFPGFKTIEIQIPAAGISFKIQLGTHDNSEAQFLANVDSIFLEENRLEESVLASRMHKINVQSQNTTVTNSGAFTPREGPIYLLHETLGKGEFGRVYKAIDVSTGATYAGKAFYRPEWTREVAIMKKVTHRHIVSFVDFRENPTPLLVMEYLHLGNLADEHSASPIAFEETITILVQALQALEYLHSQGLVHRDIKPENILVSCRSPLAIKLADLGLAKDSREGQSLFKSWVGSRLYAAPEIWNGSPYTPAVDIWSLGVVALEFAYGLPKRKSGKFNPQDWHRRIAKAARDRDSDDRIDFLPSSMLQLKSERRHSASGCLEIVLSIDSAQQRMLEVRNYQTGSATPTEKFSAFASLARISEHEEPILDCEDYQRSATPSTVRLGGGDVEKVSQVTERAERNRYGSKRQSSPDVNFREDCYSSRKTAVRGPRVHSAESFSRTYPISDLATGISGQPGTMCERVLELIKDMQNGDGSEGPDLRTPGLVVSLCHHFKRLEIDEVKILNDHVTERTIVTAVSKVREFIVASLTSSDLASSVLDLAQHLTHMMQLLSPDPTTFRSHRVSYTSHQYNREEARSRNIGNLIEQTDSLEALQIRRERRQSTSILLSKAIGHVSQTQGVSLHQQADWTPTEKASTTCDVLDHEDCETLMAPPVQSQNEPNSLPGQFTARTVWPQSPQIRPTETSDYTFEVSVDKVALGAVDAQSRKRRRLDIVYKSRNSSTGYRQASIEGSNFSVRESDGWIDALEILTLATLEPDERKYYRELIIKRLRSEPSGLSKKRRWIPYGDAKLLCDHLELTHLLDSVLKDASRYASSQDKQPSQALLSLTLFKKVHLGKYKIHIRTTNLWINATNIVKAAGHVNDGRIGDRTDLQPVEIIRKGLGGSRGTYVSPAKGLLLCREYNLIDLAERLETFLLQNGCNVKDSASRSGAQLPNDDYAKWYLSDAEIDCRCSTSQDRDYNIQPDQTGICSDSRVDGAHSEPEDLASGQTSHVAQSGAMVRHLANDPRISNDHAQEAAIVSGEVDVQLPVSQESNPQLRNSLQNRISYYSEPSFDAGSFLPPLKTSVLLAAQGDDEPSVESRSIDAKAPDPGGLSRNSQLFAHPSGDCLSLDPQWPTLWEPDSQ